MFKFKAIWFSSVLGDGHFTKDCLSLVISHIILGGMKMKQIKQFSTLLLIIFLVFPAVSVHGENIQNTATKEEIGSTNEDSSNTLYVLQSYTPEFIKKDKDYKSVGISTLTNNTKEPIEHSYVQPSTVTLHADVTTNILENEEVKQVFLEKSEAAANCTGTYVKIWNQGEGSSVLQSVPAGATSTFTKYAVGVTSKGFLTYKKYISGIFAGYYTEPCGGTILSDSDGYIVLD